MANETTSSTLSELYTEIVAEALFVAQEASVLRNLVTNYNITGQGKEISVPIYAAVSAAAVAEATDLSNTDLIALFDGFSTGKASDDTPLTAANVFEVAATLRNQNLPINECALVIPPTVAYDLKANATNSFVNPADARLQNNIMTTGFIGSVGGLNVYESSNVTNSGTTGDYKCGAFHPSALGLAMKQDIKVETQRDASLRGTEIVATAVWGEGEIYDSYGVEVEADSSIE